MKNLKIAFLIPPAEKEFKVPERIYGCSFNIYNQPNLPLLYVAGAIENFNGMKNELTLVDFPLEKRGWDDFTEYVKNNDFDVYIFQTVLLSQRIDLNALKIIREKTQNPIIFFGPQPTYIPNTFTVDENTYVVRGEPEVTMQELVSYLAKNNLKKDLKIKTIKGISYLFKGKFVENETFGIIKDLDILPPPARHLVSKYKKMFFNPKLNERPVTLVLASRGCAYRCYFCVPNAVSWARELEWRRFHNNKKPAVGLRSAKSIAEEFNDIKKEGYKSVSFIDDMFMFGGKQRILDICKVLKDINVPFGLLARCDHMQDEELVKALAEAGCKYVDLGVESFNKEILDYVRKDMDPELIAKTVNILNKYHIEPKVNIMFGTCHLDTKENIQDTIKKTLALPVDYAMFSITTPFPGTDFERVAKEKGWLNIEKYDEMLKTLDPSKASLINYPHLSGEEMEKLSKQANRRFYLRPKRIIRQIKKLKSPKDVVDTIKGGIQLMR